MLNMNQINNMLDFIVSKAILLGSHKCNRVVHTARIGNVDRIQCMVINRVMDKRLTPSPWTTLMDYQNGLPLNELPLKKSYFATQELPGTNNIKNISCYPYNIKS